MFYGEPANIVDCHAEIEAIDKQHIGLGANLHFLGDTEFGKCGLKVT